MPPKDAGEKANSADSDQTATITAVWSGSKRFAWAYLLENFWFVPLHAV